MRLCMRQSGFSMVEMLITLTIIGLLVTIATLSFNRMTRKSNIESQIKQMHADLMTVRIWAMDRNACHFVLLNSNGSYSVYEDQPPPNNTCLYSAADGQPLLSKSATNPALWNNAAPSSNVYLIFNNRGLASVSTGSIPGSISITDTVGAAYDCILVETTRTSIGKMSGGTCVPQ